MIPQKPILLSIEGNIGAGKSTLIKQLKAKRPDWYFVDEPVDQWLAMKNEAGESLLELFYKDKRRWGYTFQNAALLTRIMNLKEVLGTLPLVRMGTPPVIVMERSVETDSNVFAKMLHEDGLIDGLEMDLYTKWFGSMKKDLPPVSGYIHIDTPVTICHSRIHERGREGESIPTAYLDRLDSAHFAWLRGTGQKVPVLRYDNYTPKQGTTIYEVEAWVQRLLLESVD
jgi:deoxyadenosine/deoxycytidine kinase